LIPKLTAKQQAHFDKMPERNKETMRAFWASEARIALGSSGANFKATRSEIPSPSPRATKPLHPKTEERRTYIERYGKDMWEKAITVAGRHRARASKDFGLTEHFTAPEWLDLCAQTDFCCSRCGANAALQAHHRTALSTLGPNTIGNIEPLCVDCHRLIPVPSQKEDVGAEWLAAQDKIYERRPPIGSLIGSPFCPGVVEGVTPPFLGPGPLWGRGRQPDPRWPGGFRDMYIADDSTEILEFLGIYPPVQAVHIPVQISVRWPGAEEAVGMEMYRPSIVDPRAAKAEALRWLQEQDLLLASWRVGEYVRHRHHSRRGVIEQIIPCKAAPLSGFVGEADPPPLPLEWVPQAPVSTRVRWIKEGKKKTVTHVSLVTLVRLGAEAAALVRERMAVER